MSSPPELIRAVIVDDEPLAREGLRRMLERERDVTIVGEAKDGPEAVRLIRRTVPQLAFMDIRLPGMDGFEVLSRLGRDRPPAVVFVTAFGAFGVRAFQGNAVDYLLKPFNQDRLGGALQRARLRLATLQSQATPPPRGTVAAAERIAVRSGGRILLLPVADIVWISALNHRCRIHAAGSSHLINESLVALSARLPALQFLRLNRSEVVNRNHVIEVRPKSHGDCHVRLKTGVVLTLSRLRRVDVVARLDRAA